MTNFTTMTKLIETIQEYWLLCPEMTFMQLIEGLRQSMIEEDLNPLKVSDEDLTKAVSQACEMIDENLSLTKQDFEC